MTDDTKESRLTKIMIVAGNFSVFDFGRDGESTE